MIVALVLAAGEGSRFAGSDGSQSDNKLLQDIAGIPLIARALSPVIASGFDRIVVVVARQAREIEEAIHASHPNHPALQFVTNPVTHAGHMTSLKLGLASAGAACTAAMVFLADMPLITRTTIVALRAEFEATGMFVLPLCDGQPRHPRVIPRRFFDAFQELDDRQRGTLVFDRHQDELATVSVGEPHEFLDVDNAEDLVQVRRHFGRR